MTAEQLLEHVKGLPFEYHGAYTTGNRSKKGWGMVHMQFAPKDRDNTDVFLISVTMYPQDAVKVMDKSALLDLDLKEPKA